MATCRCTSLKHPEHLDRVCENLATEPDGYCRACHDRANQEWAQKQTNPPPGGSRLFVFGGHSGRARRNELFQEAEYRGHL